MSLFERIFVIVLMAGTTGCADLKDRFGTGVETRELRAARAECKALAQKQSTGKYYNPVIFDACLKEKGYDRLGRKIQ